MSTGLIGTIGSVATGQLQQGRATDADRIGQDAASQARKAESSQRATDAAGIGQTEEEGQTSDRDADGRRLWERPSPEVAKSKQNEPAEDPAPPLSKDPSGAAGNQIDLSG